MAPVAMSCLSNKVQAKPRRAQSR
ncbi:hypothetical protein YPPY47_4441, partial [Yersinia pestis PY-47]